MAQVFKDGEKLTLFIPTDPENGQKVIDAVEEEFSEKYGGVTT